MHALNNVVSGDLHVNPSSDTDSLQIWERRRRIPSQVYNDPLSQLFTEFDADGDGHLTAQEISDALRCGCSHGEKFCPFTCCRFRLGTLSSQCQQVPHWIVVDIPRRSVGPFQITSCSGTLASCSHMWYAHICEKLRQHMQAAFM